MSLSDKKGAQDRNVRRRGVNQMNKHWSDAQKIEAVTLWLSMGNLRLVGATLRIPEDTIRKWRMQNWWKEIADEIQLQDKIQLSATAKNIIDKSLSTIADRLEHGDWIYDQKSGQMRRKPVGMKDALAVADRLMDRKEQLDKVQVQEHSVESVEQKLNKLMEKFSAIASVPAQVTDIIYVEGQNEQRTSTESSRKPTELESTEDGMDDQNRSAEGP